MAVPGPIPKAPITRLGQALVERRGSRSQTVVAAEIGVSRQTYGHAEAGTHVPSMKTARALANWLNWPVNRVMHEALRPAGSEVIEDSSPDGACASQAPVVSVIRAAREFGIEPATIAQLVIALDRGEEQRDLPTELGSAVLARRKGIPLVEAAHAIGLTTERLHYIEQGLVRPDPTEAKALAHWLGWEVSDVNKAGN